MQDNDSLTTTLLESARDGDLDSWGTLLSNSVNRLARLITLRMDRRLQGRLDPDDVIQEIYVEAWQHLPDYRHNSSLPFYLWLRGLARNKLLELHRQHLGTKMRDVRREAKDFRHAAFESASSVLSSILADSSTSPSGVAAREERKLRLQRALEAMDELDREVLLLRHFEHLTPTETAHVLQINDKSAGMRYVRAIKRLRSILAALPGGLSGFRI